MANKAFINGVENALGRSIDVWRKSGRCSALSDLFVAVDPEEGVVSIYDDNEELLHKERINELIGVDLDPRMIDSLRCFFARESVREQLETLPLLKPFSVVLVDHGLNALEELLLIDDETLLLNNELLEKYDRELNDFLKKLLES